MDVIKDTKRKYRVQSSSSQSFRLTIPKELSDLANINRGDTLGINVKISDNKCVIDFHKNSDRCEIKREVSGQNLLIRIPSSVGGSMKIQRDMVKWKLGRVKGDYVLRVTTSYYPLIISDSSWSKIGQSSFSREGSNSFSIYIGSVLSKNINWDESSKIGFLIAQKNGELCLRCQPIREIQDRISSTRPQPVNTGGDNYRLYVPKDLIYTIGYSETRFDIFENNNAIAIVD